MGTSRPNWHSPRSPGPPSSGVTRQGSFPQRRSQQSPQVDAEPALRQGESNRHNMIAQALRRLVDQIEESSDNKIRRRSGVNDGVPSDVRDNQAACAKELDLDSLTRSHVSSLESRLNLAEEEVSNLTSRVNSSLKQLELAFHTALETVEARVREVQVQQSTMMNDDVSVRITNHERACRKDLESLRTMIETMDERAKLTEDAHSGLCGTVFDFRSTCQNDMETLRALVAPKVEQQQCLTDLEAVRNAVHDLTLVSRRQGQQLERLIRESASQPLGPNLEKLSLELDSGCGPDDLLAVTSPQRVHSMYQARSPSTRSGTSVTYTELGSAGLLNTAFPSPRSLEMHQPSLNSTEASLENPVDRTMQVSEESARTPRTRTLISFHDQRTFQSSTSLVHEAEIQKRLVSKQASAAIPEVEPNPDPEVSPTEAPPKELGTELRRKTSLSLLSPRVAPSPQCSLKPAGETTPSLFHTDWGLRHTERTEPSWMSSTLRKSAHFDLPPSGCRPDCSS